MLSNSLHCLTNLTVNRPAVGSGKVSDSLKQALPDDRKNHSTLWGGFYLYFTKLFFDLRLTNSSFCVIINYSKNKGE